MFVLSWLLLLQGCSLQPKLEVASNTSLPQLETASQVSLVPEPTELRLRVETILQKLDLELGDLLNLLRQPDMNTNVQKLPAKPL